MDPTQQIAGALLILALGALIAVFGIAWTGRRLTLRPLPGLETLRGQQSRAIESGTRLHLSLGTSGIGGGNTAVTLAGLAILESLADEAAATDTPPMNQAAQACDLRDGGCWAASLRQGVGERR